MNIFTSIDKYNRETPDKTAIVFSNERITYEELWRNINSLCAGLRELGLKNGDRIALLMNNCPEMIFSFYAAMKLGVINVSLNIMFKKDELDYILSDAEPKVLIAHSDFMPLVKTLELVKQNRLKVVKVDTHTTDSNVSIPFQNLMEASPESPGIMDLDPDAEAVIGYTSGTTGFPKGAVHTHQNILYHLNGMSKNLNLNETDTLLAALPFFQLTAFLIHPGLAFYVGATLVIMEKFEPITFLELVNKEKVTFFAGVPTIYQMLFDEAQNGSGILDRVRFGICAGAPLSLKLRQNFEKEMNFRIIHCYGSTETPLIAAFERLDQKSKEISVGNVSPHVEMQLVKPNGEIAASGEEGEIQLGAEKVLKCYWNNPEATRKAIKDGWFSTGDIGRFDEEGYLHIVDRSKDMIIRGGFNIYPAEIERVLLQDHRIKEVAVIGVPHKRLGEIPKGYITTEEGGQITESDVVALISELT